MARACVDPDYFTVSGSGELTMKPGAMGFQDTVIFSNVGNFQFNKASYPLLARVRVRVLGGGGGSAGADADPGELIARQGGAGGGYAEATIAASALGAVTSVVVGAGGQGGSTGNSPGSDGSGSSFGGFATALGGAGSDTLQTSGTAIDVTSGVSAPLAGIGDLAIGGGAGGGAFRLSATRGMSGAGGDSQYGFGGRELSFQSAGNAPRGFGAGASGALSTGGAVAGADGSRGFVIVELYY